MINIYQDINFNNINKIQDNVINNINLSDEKLKNDVFKPYIEDACKQIKVNKNLKNELDNDIVDFVEKMKYKNILKQDSLFSKIYNVISDD